MTIHDDYEVHVLRAYNPIFWGFVAISVVLFYYSLGYAQQYSTSAAFLLTPFICFSLIFDNSIMATTMINRRRSSTQAMLAFHACIVPMLLLVYYELAYLVHKHKCVNFCGFMFETTDGGKNVRPIWKHRWRLSVCLRLVVWIISCILLVLNLLVAYHWTTDLSPEITSFYELKGNKMTHVISAILPAVVLVILSLYTGLQLWNYGTNYSYTVHATCCNPWIWMFIGAISLLVGYFMPSPIHALSSNAGEVIMMVTIVRVFRKVHYDMQQGLQLGDFIDPEGAAARRKGSTTFGVRCMNWSIVNTRKSESKITDEGANRYMASRTPKDSGLSATYVALSQIISPAFQLLVVRPT